MKLLLLLFVAVVSSQEFYQTEDDKLDSTSMSVKDLRAVIQCINDRGPCTRVTASYRQHYPGIVQDYVTSTRRVTKELPDELEATKRRHDPDGKYWNSYLASISNEC